MVIILDKQLNKKLKDIFFVKVKNDGFSLNANRNKIEGSELKEIIKLIRDFYRNENNKNLQKINKEKILKKKDLFFNFNEFS